MEGTEWAKAQRCEKEIPFLRTGKAGDMVHMETRFRGKKGRGQVIKGLAACVRVSGQRIKQDFFVGGTQACFFWPRLNSVYLGNILWYSVKKYSLIYCSLCIRCYSDNLYRFI